MAKSKQNHDDDFDLDLDAEVAEPAEDEEIVTASADDDALPADLDDVQAAEDADVVDAVEDADAADDAVLAEDVETVTGAEDLEFAATAKDASAAEDDLDLEMAKSGDDAEVAEADDAEVADADVGYVADVDDAELPPPIDDEDEEPQPPPKPRLRPKVTALTLVLCFLNILAALGFVFLLMLDFEKRQSHAYAVYVHDMELRGQGIKEDRSGPNAAEMTTQLKLTSEALKAAAGQRGVTASEPYTSIEGSLNFSDYNQMSPEILADLRKLSGIPDLGESIEKELERLKNKLLTDIGEAADAVAKDVPNTDAAKREKILKLLYPLCLTPVHIQELEKAVGGTPAPNLDALLKESVERRILADIMLPIEMFRPADPEKTLVEDAADINKVKLSDLRDLMTQRLDAATKDKHDGGVYFGKEWDGKERWTIEKRQNAAYLMVSIACVRKPVDKAAKLEDVLLYPDGLKRAQRVSGLYDFTVACRAFNDALRALEQRVVGAVELDRDGFRVQTPAGVKRGESFADKHAAVIGRMRQTQVEIRKTEERIAELERQRDVAKKTYEDRLAVKANLEKRIAEERTTSAKKMAELRVLQEQLHRALVIQADAAEENVQYLEKYKKLSKSKGARP